MNFENKKGFKVINLSVVVNADEAEQEFEMLRELFAHYFKLEFSLRDFTVAECNRFLVNTTGDFTEKMLTKKTTLQKTETPS